MNCRVSTDVEYKRSIEKYQHGDSLPPKQYTIGVRERAVPMRNILEPRYGTTSF